MIRLVSHLEAEARCDRHRIFFSFSLNSWLLPPFRFKNKSIWFRGQSILISAQSAAVSTFMTLLPPPSVLGLPSRTCGHQWGHLIVKGSTWLAGSRTETASGEQLADSSAGTSGPSGSCHSSTVVGFICQSSKFSLATRCKQFPRLILESDSVCLWASCSVSPLAFLSLPVWTLNFTSFLLSDASFFSL